MEHDSPSAAPGGRNMSNLYAVDGRCHNANRGTYGHECSRPATWIGTSRAGFRSGYCSHCKEHGDEARECVAWEARECVAWDVTMTVSSIMILTGIAGIITTL